MFPSFDHAKKDPEQGTIKFDGADGPAKDQVILVEGLYVLLSKEPWSNLSKDVFDKTFFIDTDLKETAKRLQKRMTSEMGLSPEEAESRIVGNDLVNAAYIHEFLDRKQQNMVKLVAS